MGEKKFTLIELNLQGDHQFGPRAIDDALPFGEKREEADLEGEEELEGEAEAEEEGGGKGAIGALIALVVLVALGVAAKKYTEGDEAEEFPEDEQPDVVVT
ncbi:hypothetical protein C491_12780 [Natronococcus amylolyticus DSM 10524]|uniref:Uncharacterized protein n=1 Tax=Natronococcus amylolyticus DSM 10524 TaxID=1227497 RepID=L9X518_9EURY|nr:hypothetical protein [Natronococcus amylolyticus]ELY56879.1 hypothetical protein C491_12780 [Natronococcus amylolyticus DSM 10524]